MFDLLMNLNYLHMTAALLQTKTTQVIITILIN